MVQCDGHCENPRKYCTTIMCLECTTFNSETCDIYNKFWCSNLDDGITYYYFPLKIVCKICINDLVQIKTCMICIHDFILVISIITL